VRRGGGMGSLDVNSGSVDYLKLLLTFLTTWPDSQDICNHMVIGWPGPDVIQQAAIGQVLNDGSVVFTGWFGYEPEVNRVFGKTSIWDDLPSSIAIREKRTYALSSRQEVADQLPHLSTAMPHLGLVIATPLLSHDTPVGVCVISSAAPSSDVEAASLVLENHALAISTYFARTQEVAGDQTPLAAAESIPPARMRHIEPPRQAFVPSQLTERQLLVMQYLVVGITNRQIALRLGFSESTIRQETMAIYAYLGVKGRKEAAEAAILRGLVSQDDLDDFYPTPSSDS